MFGWSACSCVPTCHLEAGARGGCQTRVSGTAAMRSTTGMGCPGPKAPSDRSASPKRVQPEPQNAYSRYVLLCRTATHSSCRHPLIVRVHLAQVSGESTAMFEICSRCDGDDCARIACDRCSSSTDQPLRRAIRQSLPHTLTPPLTTEAASHLRGPTLLGSLPPERGRQPGYSASGHSPPNSMSSAS